MDKSVMDISIVGNNSLTETVSVGCERKQKKMCKWPQLTIICSNHNTGVFNIGALSFVFLRVSKITHFSGNYKDQKLPLLLRKREKDLSEKEKR